MALNQYYYCYYFCRTLFPCLLVIERFAILMIEIYKLYCTFLSYIYFAQDNYKLYQEAKPKKLRKKVKPSAMTRPQKRNKKKKRPVVKVLESPPTIIEEPITTGQFRKLNNYFSPPTKTMRNIFCILVNILYMTVFFFLSFK